MNTLINLLNKIEEVSRIFSEKLARKVDRKDFLKASVGGIFAGLIAFTLKPSSAGATLYCQVTSSATYCSPPRQTYCNNCPTSAVARCPVGYKVSYAWGYKSTGCWCIRGGAARCCDCTTSDPYSQGIFDCGCALFF